MSVVEGAQERISSDAANVRQTNAVSRRTPRRHSPMRRAGAMNDYHRAVVENLPACRSCWVRHFCGGGCFYDNLARSGDMQRPDPDVCREMQTVCEDVVCGWCALGDQDQAYAREQIEKLAPEPRS